jgi:ribosome-binding protein aMBF1 (putative translation factor)
VIEELRDGIRRSGMCLKELGGRAGVDPSVLSRFLRAERSLTLPTAERLSKLLGLELVRRAPREGDGP